jgi:hypothetical protein
MEELDEIRPIWQSMQFHPNTDYDFYRLIVSVRDNVLSPYVLLLSVDGKVEAMLIGRLENVRIDCKIGYRTLLRPRVRSITVLHGGFFGIDRPEIAQQLVDALMLALRNGDADVVCFSPTPVDTHLFQASVSRPGYFCRNHLVRSAAHHCIHLPPTYDEFLQRLKSKHRSELQRYKRKMEKDHDGKVRLACYSRVEDVDDLCRDVERIAAKTYQRGLGVGFRDNAEYEMRLRLEAEKGWLRGLVLYVGDEPAAYRIMTIYRDTCHASGTGYDPDKGKYRIGTILLLMALEMLCGEGVYKYDLGQGSAEYKERFGSEEWQEALNYIFAPSVKGVTTNSVYTLITGLHYRLKSLAESTGSLQKVKKWWRQRKTGDGDVPTNPEKASG